MKFTCEMSAADIGRLFKYSQRKVAPPCLMIALRLVGGKLAFEVLLVPHIVFDIWLGEQMLEIPGEFAFLVHVRCQEGNSCSLHFSIGHGVHELSLRLKLNVGLILQTQEIATASECNKK